MRQLPTAPPYWGARGLKDDELLLGVDLDDDGKVYSAQDAQKDLQAKLDEQREASSATS